MIATAQSFWPVFWDLVLLMAGIALGFLSGASLTSWWDGDGGGDDLAIGVIVGVAACACLAGVVVVKGL